MTELPDISHPPDICLLLRAHGEQRWLVSEVVPVLRQIERPGSIPEDQLGAALAYLETLWLDASRRAAETDAAYAQLDTVGSNGDRVLFEKARRYHAAVRRLRGAVGHRVHRLICARGETITRWPAYDRYASS
jgi:hypothetical protein